MIGVVNQEKGGEALAREFDNLLSLSRAAIQRYDMIAPGDRVAVGVSGGKDSVALLAVLARLRTFYPVPFSLVAITLDPCFNGKENDFSTISALCEQLQVPYVVKRTRLYEVVFEERQESNPCSLCARMRRGALHKAAREEGCNVVALGHHKDDAAETLWMNLMAGGRLGCFAPKSYLDKSELTLIRPLVFADEKTVAAAVRQEALPIVPSGCPVDGVTHRKHAREQLDALSKEYGPLADKFLNALQQSGLDGWG